MAAARSTTTSGLVCRPKRFRAAGIRNASTTCATRGARATGRLSKPATVGSLVDRENGPASEDARNGPAPHFDQATRVNSVNVQSFGETRIRSNAVQLSLTRHVEGFAARSHDVKVGIEHERTRRTQSQRYPGDTLYLDRDGQPELVWFWAGAITRPSFHRTSAFVQDGWRLSERVTLEPGLRLGYYRSSLPDTTARLYENQSVSPRIGAAWDLAADHRTVVRAHYGHYHEGMYTGLFEFLDPLANAPLITARVTGPGQFEEIRDRRRRSIRRPSIRMRGTCIRRSTSPVSSVRSGPGYR